MSLKKNSAIGLTLLSYCRLFMLAVCLVFMRQGYAQKGTPYATKTEEERHQLWDDLQNKTSKFNALAKDSTRFGELLLRLISDEDNQEHALTKNLWLQQSSWWPKTPRKTRVALLSLAAEQLAYNGRYKEAAFMYNESLQKYAAELKRDPELYVFVLLELANNYAEFGKKSMVVDLVKKALKVCHAYPEKVKLNDFLTAYNNLLYYDFNEANFSAFRDEKLNILDNLVVHNRYAQNYLDIIFNKFDIIYHVKQGDYESVRKKIALFESTTSANAEQESQKFSYLLSIFPIFISDLINAEENYAAATKEVENYYALSLKAKSASNEIYALSLKANVEHKQGQYENSIAILQDVIDRYAISENSYSYYSIQIFKAYNQALQGEIEHAEKELDATLQLFVATYIGEAISLESINNYNFKELNNGTALSFFSTAAMTYAKLFENNHDKTTGRKAESFARAASNMFVHNYSQGEFDEDLAIVHQRIAEAFLSLICSNFNTDQKTTRAFLNIIEQNSSAHVFKAFQRQLIQAHPTFRDLYFKQKNLENNIAFLEGELLLQDNSDAKRKRRIHLDSLQRIEQTIQNELGGFYNLRSDYDIEKVLQKLEYNEQIIKFQAANENLYRIILTKDTIEVTCLSSHNELRAQTLQYAAFMQDPLSNYKALGQKLGELLFPSSSKQHQIIIPDRYLHYLNFETLLDENGQFLLNKHHFSYQPSLLFWYATRFYPKLKNRKEILCLTAEYDSSSGLNPLKFAQLEAEEILKTFDGKHLRGITARQFQEEVSNYAVAHLAMHAVVSEDQNEPSRLVFSNNEEIEFSQLYAMHLPLEMMVLSACNTGTGRIKNGEGIMSLSRALMLSGVRSNVVSLWPASDQDAREIMVHFYQNLKHGERKDEALAHAKRDYLKKNPLKSHPFFWGNFVLNGDVAPIFESSGIWMWRMLWFTLAILLFFVLRSFYRKSLSKRSA